MYARYSCINKKLAWRPVAVVNESLSTCRVIFLIEIEDFVLSKPPQTRQLERTIVLCWFFVFSAGTKAKLSIYLFYLSILWFFKFTGS